MHAQLFKKITFLFFNLCLIGGISYSSVSAQGILPGETGDQPKDRGTSITTIVPDIIAPSQPALIAPLNSSSHASSPTFIWTASTDNVGVVEYVFILDGQVFQTLPTIAQVTQDYVLEYDAITEQYSVIFLKTIPDGNHSWNVVAKDLAGNATSSVIWGFLLDTTPPIFVVETIDSILVNISAQDSSTVPNQAIQLRFNEPEIKGFGEINSGIELKVYREKNKQDLFGTYTGTIDGNGRFSLKTGVIPRGVTLYLNFVITDALGWKSYINDVPIILPETQVVELTPEITIPILPPQEAIELVRWEFQLFVYSSFIQPIAEVVEEIKEVVTEPIKPIIKPIEELMPELLESVVLEATPIRDSRYNTIVDTTPKPTNWWGLLALVGILALPVTKLMILSWRNRKNLTLSLFFSAFHVVGLAPKKPLQLALIIEADSLKPMSGVLVEVWYEKDKRKMSFFSDQEGRILINDRERQVLSDCRLVCWNNHEAMELAKRNELQKKIDCYQGEVINIKDVITAGGLVVRVKSWTKNGLIEKVLTVSNYPWLAIFATILITIFQPSYFNVIFCSLAGVLWVLKVVINYLRSADFVGYYRTGRMSERFLYRVHPLGANASVRATNHKGEGKIIISSQTTTLIGLNQNNFYSESLVIHAKNRPSDAQIPLLFMRGQD